VPEIAFRDDVGAALKSGKVRLTLALGRCTIACELYERGLEVPGLDYDTPQPCLEAT